MVKFKCIRKTRHWRNAIIGEAKCFELALVTKGGYIREVPFVISHTRRSLTGISDTSIEAILVLVMIIVWRFVAWWRVGNFSNLLCWILMNVKDLKNPLDVPVVLPKHTGSGSLVMEVDLCSWNLVTSHYNDVIMSEIASQITSLTIVYSIVYSDADQRKHQSSASLAFVWGIHRGPVNSRTKGQWRGKCFHLMTSS